MKLSEDHIQFFSIQALLSNGPLKNLFNNLDGIYDDSTRIRFSMENVPFTAKCFNRLQTIRKDHVNNKELMGLLLSPILTYNYKLLLDVQKNKPRITENFSESKKRSSLRASNLTEFPEINKTNNIPENLKKIGKFIFKFKMSFPVFKQYFISQGIGSSLNMSPVSIDDIESTQKLLFKDDFANDAFFMSLFYFVTLFGKSDPNLNEQYFQNFLFEFFIKNRFIFFFNNF